ncbi:KH domain-containing protein At4g18375 isoform X1 [Solanum pennellii]|uniref:KH domain-containing protein At4g18375 isoform X1 n=1 Tax=Solanum pennellii TaxID=28526 RepID=A0ABM1FU13_SOLPN|nr:KH domain-containing protein At4g18375 isoform X1 [Solanum pennellii]
MDSSFAHKRHLDTTTAFDTSTPTTKRRHQLLPSSATPPSNSFRTPPPPPPFLKLSPGEAFFRILCPADKTGGVIGKGGAIIRQLREETGAKIRIDDSLAGCDERVIVVIADSTKKDQTSSDAGGVNGEELPHSAFNDESSSQAQRALIRVLERILKVDEEGNAVPSEGEGRKDEFSDVRSPQGVVICRLLAPSNQVGSVLGKGGKIIEKIRQESGAQVRVLPKDQMPACALPGDELIQITGSFSTVRKALLSVSSCLQDNSRVDLVNPSTPRFSGMSQHGTGYHTPEQFSRSSGVESAGINHRMVLEEEVVFKVLCPVDKVGNLIGKGGSIIRVMQTETGASVKVADSASDVDERIVVISARENLEQRHSPAQEAVMRVLGRIAEIGFEPGAAVVSRLLVHARHMSCLFANGGILIAELRRVTGASIRIFPREQSPKYGSHTEEVLQVIGSMQSVQDALFQITCRLRDAMFPVKPHVSTIVPPHFPPYSEIPSPSFMPRHDPASPSYHSPVGYPQDRAPHFYGYERQGHAPYFDRPPSPGRWGPQGDNSRYTAGVADCSSASEAAPNLPETTVEMVIPEMYIKYVYGEDSSNLHHIKRISGAKVVIHDPVAGSASGSAILSGTKDQVEYAQTLIHAFILCEKGDT